MSLPSTTLIYLESLYEEFLEEGYQEEQAQTMAWNKLLGEDYVPTNTSNVLPVDRVMEISSSN